MWTALICVSSKLQELIIDLITSVCLPYEKIPSIFILEYEYSDAEPPDYPQ